MGAAMATEGSARSLLSFVEVEDGYVCFISCSGGVELSACDSFLRHVEDVAMKPVETDHDESSPCPSLSLAAFLA